MIRNRNYLLKKTMMMIDIYRDNKKTKWGLYLVARFIGNIQN